MTRTLESLLDWVPKRSAFAILSCQHEQSHFSVSQDGGASFVTHAVSSLLRPSAKGDAMFGATARSWHGRDPEVRSVFQGSHPVWPKETSRYLRWFLKEHWSQTPPKKLFVAQDERADWSRELWTEALESTPFKLADFISPLQRRLALAQADWKESGLRRVVLLQMAEQRCHWWATELGHDTLRGTWRGLGLSQLRSHLKSYARSVGLVELADQELDRLLWESRWAEHSHARGRHLGSGLPTERLVDWTGFWRKNGPLRRQLMECLDQMLVQLQGGQELNPQSLRSSLQARGYYLLLDGPAWPLLLSGIPDQ